MIYLKIIQLLLSILMIYVTYALDTSDSNAVHAPRNLLGNISSTTYVENGHALSLSEHSGELENNEFNKGPTHPSMSEERLADGKGRPTQKQHLEISDLFSNTRNRGSTLFSSAVSTTTPNMTKIHSTLSVAADISSSVNDMPSSITSRSRSSKPLAVPSEGGLTQEFFPVTSTGMKVSSVRDHLGNKSVPLNLDESQSSSTLSSKLGIFPHEGDVSVVKKQPKSHDSHVSARKGANLLEEPDQTNVSISNGTSQFTFSSSESQSIKEVSSSKITARKGAEPPKIFSRKGVEEKVDNFNSSDQYFNETPNRNNGAISTNTPLTVPNISSVSASDLHNVTDAKTSSGNPYQNKITVDHLKTNASVILTSLSTKPTVGTSTGKIETAAEFETKSIYSNVSMPATDIKNDTLEDKSGIKASYPPLKKRLKPHITTDTNTLNSSPSPVEHTSSGRDFVVPIVVTILTIPMLVVLVLFLYKKGSEFWERRHYRRMDFLIDGMYND